MIPASEHKSSALRKKLLAAAASVAIAGAVGVGAIASGTVPVFADPVKVTAPQVPNFADVVEQVSPAVVSVRVKSNVQTSSDGGTFFGPRAFEDLPDNHPLKRFFREFGGDREFRGDRDRGNRPEQRDRRSRERMRPTSQGSGFFISEDGYLVTNNHVVEGGSEFTIVNDKGDEMDARLIGTDPRTDLAVLKVDGKEKLTYVSFADDSKIRVGEWVVAVGNPFGLGGTVTAGIVSARGRDIGTGPYDDFIQIDAAVNRGNSGGPTFNLSGEVVGVNTAIFSPSGGNIGIAFAIPSSTVNEVVQDLMKTGTVSRGWLGVQIQPVNKDIAESLGLAEAKGALVSDITGDSPAGKSGIAVGDVITAVDGKEVASPKELARLIGADRPGKSVEVSLWRKGKTESVKVELGTMPDSDKQAAVEQSNPAGADMLADLGLTVTPDESGKGVVVTDVEPGSDAADKGVQVGDVIVSVNSKEVSSGADVIATMEEAAKANRKAVLLQIMRDNASRFVALPVAQG